MARRQNPKIERTLKRTSSLNFLFIVKDNILIIRNESGGDFLIC